MKIASPLRKFRMPQHPVGRCSTCQTELWDGMVVNSKGGAACMACSILATLGVERMRPLAPAGTRLYSFPRRVESMPRLAG